MSTAAQTHLAAISAGTVTKTNVIGIRKALAHVARLRAGWSGNRSNVKPAEADAIEAALNFSRPVVAGDLHATGLKQLRDPRYAKRFDESQRAIIESSEAQFRLVRFDMVGGGVFPVYQISAPSRYFERNGYGWKTGGAFLFRNIPWQNAFCRAELTPGPSVVEESTTPEQDVLKEYEATETEAADAMAKEPAQRSPWEQSLVAALVLAWTPKGK